MKLMLMERIVIYTTLLLAALTSGWAADDTRLDIKTPVTDRLLVVQGHKSSSLSKLELVSPDLIRVRGLSAVLTNVSGRAIRAISVRWIWTDAQGRPHTHDNRSDSFFLVTQPVVEAGSQLIIYPGLLIGNFPSGFTGLGIPVANTVEEFDGASAITLSIDAAIFDDGTLIGPDEGRLVEYLRARKKVAFELGNIALERLSRGEDLSDAVKAYVKEGPSIDVSPFELLWRERLARTLLKSKKGAPSLAGRLTTLPDVDVR